MTTKRRIFSKEETIRRLRSGDLQRLYRHRYRIVLPDDDAGREDLRELLLVASMAFNPERMMRNTIAQWAPWLDKAGAAQLMDDVNTTPMYLRKPDARTLGDRLRLTDQERQDLAIVTIRPFDVSDEELEKRRKAKDAERKWRKRKAKGQKPREAWLANCKSRVKPWGHPSKRRTWYRKQRAKMLAQVVGTGVSAVKLNTVVEGPVSLESQRRGNSRKGVAGKRVVAERDGVVRGRKAARG